MRKILLITVFVIVAFSTYAQNEEDAVKQVVSSAYVGGIHNGGPIEDIRKGFHPTFNMIRLMNNEIKPLSIEEWITNIEKSRKENGPPTIKTEGKYISVDVTGTAAIVELELFRDNKKIFTDYLVLYKFTEGWRIVSKTFYRHP